MKLTKPNDQFELFAEFAHGSPQARLSRIIPLTDLLGIYLFSRNNAVPPHTPASEIKPRKHEFTHRDETIAFEVRPAIISTKGEKLTKVIFPGEREQLVASAIRALAVRGDAILGTKPGKAGANLVTVAFTIRQLRDELHDTGHTFSHPEVLEALDILAKTTVSLTRARADEKPITMDYSLFTSQMRQEESYLVVLNELESQQILAGAYRSLNYPRMMQLSDPLARWIYQFVHTEHRGARKSKPNEPKRPFSITLSQLIDRGVVPRAKELRKTVQRVRDTLDVLAAADFFEVTDESRGYLEEVEKEATSGRAKIKDVTWHLFVSDDDTDGIIDAHGEAAFRNEIRMHVPLKERLEHTAKARKNLEKAAIAASEKAARIMAAKTNKKTGSGRT